MICGSLFLINSCKSIPEPTLNYIPSSKSFNSVIETRNKLIPEIPEIKKEQVREIISETAISWTNNEQNGGIIDYNSELGWNITQNALIKYNYLVSKYGSKEIPAIEKNYGVSIINGKIFLSQEYMIKFAYFNLKYKGLIE